MNKEILERYAEAKNKIRALDEFCKTIEKDILQGLLDSGEKTISEPFGIFTVQVRKNWIYTPELETAREELKSREKNEQESGVAEASEKNYLVFRRQK